MLMNKETIKFNGRDAFVKFGLDADDGLIGYQQQIDRLTSVTGVELINPAIDDEVRRFKYSNTVGNATLMFYNDLGVNSFYNMTELGEDLTITSKNVQSASSFFILDFYDTYDISKQTKLFTVYMTKILEGAKSGSTPIPKYTIGSNSINQFYYWYVPLSFLDTITGQTVDIYINFSFFHACNGKLRLYYNYANKALTTPEKMFVKARLNLGNFTWSFVASSYTIRLDQIAGDYDLNKYTQKVNDSIDKFVLDKQNFPDGIIFNYETGTYSNE
jgi:hypothetical protein